MPELPDIASPEIPLPEIPAPELIDPVVVTHVDAENIDVSVRILSPGVDATMAQESETTVVSPAPEVDITEEIQEVEPAATEPESSGGLGVNTNVSIRVLSPGDRGYVTQNDTGGGEEDVEAGADPPSPLTGAAPASTPPAAGQPNPEQYHEDNSQYQSGEDSWNWRWMLSLDCSGNATSSSTESGRQESLNWSWEWVWEWCSEASEPTPTASSAAPPAPAKPPGQDETAGDSAAAATEPWSWNWTFTFCGETREITTNSGAGTPLTWSWDWNWTWSCGSPAEDEVAAPPAPTVVVPPSSEPQDSSDDEEEGGTESNWLLQVADEPATDTLPSVWFPSFTTTSGRGAPTTFVWPTMPEPPLELTVEIAIPPVVLPVSTAPPLTSPVVPFPTSGVPAEPTSVPPPAPLTARPSPGAVHAPEPTSHSQLEVATRGAYSQPRVHHARPAKHPGAKSRRADRSRAPFLPFDGRQPRQATGTSNTGSFVPSALLFGVAALTGLIVLAAPGLGRRIPVARELSPRGLEQSPLDRPG